MAERVVIRQPLALRLYVTAFWIAWSGFLIWFVAQTLSPVSLLMLAYGGTIAYRLVRLGVTVDDQGLVVRNNVRTRRMARSEVEDFRVEVSPLGPGRAIHVLLRDGRILRLDVTRRPWAFRRARAMTERNLAALRSWLATASN